MDRRLAIDSFLMSRLKFQLDAIEQVRR